MRRNNFSAAGNFQKTGFLARIQNFSVTTWIIIVTVIVSISFLILTAFNGSLIAYFALKPENILHGKYLWTLLTHMFVHGGIAHLFVNMFVLFSLGALCERIIGRKRFFWFYLISGIFAGVLSVLFSGYFGTSALGAKIVGAPGIYMVGASGAIFAIAGLFVMLLPKLRFMIIFLPFFSLPAYLMVPLVLVLTWIASLAVGLPIGNVAHLGGFLSGIAYGVYLRSKYKRKVAMLQRMFGQ